MPTPVAGDTTLTYTHTFLPTYISCGVDVAPSYSPAYFFATKLFANPEKSVRRAKVENGGVYGSV